MEPLKGILTFSAVETLTVVLWGLLLRVGAGLPFRTQVLAVLVLFIGYVVEHIIAFNVGKDRPYLSFPRR